MADSISIPNNLLPGDGRFGSGPSRIRPEAIDGLVASSKTYLGTSHRKSTVMDVIGELRNELAELFSLPDGYEVVLANGGTTVFWDTAVQSLIAEQSEHLVFGEFSTRFMQFVERAPHLKDPITINAELGSHPQVEPREEIDTYALMHNETSTGVCMEVKRPAGINSDALVLYDATSAAGGMNVDVSQCDAYYFAPQKGFAADGGTWFALVSPAAIARAEAVQNSGRYIPVTLNFSEHLANSRENTTYNTPSLATIMLTLLQARWINENGGLSWAAARSKQMSDSVYAWANKSEFASPFVDAEMRSPVTCTIDFNDDVDASAVAKTLRANGIVDVEGYRKLNRNQLRIATFPGIEPSDIDALLTCIDYVVKAL
jgi:phosphoserine aminotransferase